MTAVDDNACTTIKCTVHILFYSQVTACALVCRYCVKNNGLSPKQHSLVLVSKDDIFLIISCMNLIKRVFCYYFCTCIFAGIFFFQCCLQCYICPAAKIRRLCRLITGSLHTSLSYYVRNFVHDGAHRSWTTAVSCQTNISVLLPS